MTSGSCLSTIGSHAAAMAMRAGGDGGATVSPGGERTLLVLGRNAEFAVALRDCLDRTLVTVIEVWPREAAETVRACAPWPWMLVGEVPQADASLTEALAETGTLLAWRGVPPPALARRALALAGFSEVVAAVDRALHAVVGGISLATGSGLTMPDGTHAGSAPLEALVSAHPRPVLLPVRHVRAADDLLGARGVGLRALRRAEGAVLLEREVA